MSADFFASNLAAAPSPVEAPPPAASSVVHAGLWQLHAHQAMSLRPAIDRELHIASGRVWVTLHAPAHAHAAAPYQLPEGEWVWPAPQAPSTVLGDHVLQAGDRLWVPAGSHLVMEAWSPAGEAAAPVYFDWFDLSAAPVTVPSRFQHEVLIPLRASASALGEAAGASTRSLGLLLQAVWGLLRYSEYLIPRRGQALSDLESCRS